MANLRWQQLALPIGILLCLLVIYAPLPTWLMDWLLAANLAFSVAVLLTAVVVRSPLEVSVFPALLLFLTLGRIALNVATTRLILARGPIDGELAAGQVIRSFSQFVTGDQIAIGVVIFAILFVIQFLVITKGATRIGEVAARFALDGLPGKQLAIDADLNAGLIDIHGAQQRRMDLVRFADFYGTMDGASKYIRGDAVAGLVITAVNILVGLGIGLWQGMPLDRAVETFTKLTIGDGLVSQLPALLISIAAGVLVSRGSAESDLAEQSVFQVFSQPIVLFATAGFLVVLAFTNLPTIPLLSIAGLLAIGGINQQEARKAKETQSLPTPMVPAVNREPTMEKLLEHDLLEVQVGGSLIALADSRQGGTLLQEITLVRQRLAAELGIILPRVRIRDNLSFSPRQFEVRLQGNRILRAEVVPDRRLTLGVTHLPATEWCHDLPWCTKAAWLSTEVADGLPQATQFSAAAAIAQTVSWVARKHADELLNREAVQQLVDEAAKQNPTVVAEMRKREISIARVQTVATQLVLEGVSLRPMATILETIVDRAAAATDMSMVEAIRYRLRRQICQRLANDQNVIRCITFADNAWELLAEELAAATDVTTSRVSRASGAVFTNLLQAVETANRHLREMGLVLVILVPMRLRSSLSIALKSLRPDVYVIGDAEVEDAYRLEILARVSANELTNTTTQAA